MRLQINCKAPRNFHIPFNYNYTLAAIIYNKIHDLNLARRIHDKKGFKFFTFSNLDIPHHKIHNNCLVAPKGKFSFQISTPNKELLESMLISYTLQPILFWGKTEIEVSKVEILTSPKFKKNMNFTTKSPIFVKSWRFIDGIQKVWDLAPSTEQFYKHLEKNLLRKYCEYNNLTTTDLECEFSSALRFVKSKKISIQNIYHRAYIMDINLKGDKELIEFAYDSGVGGKCSMGFGMLVHDKTN